MHIYCCLDNCWTASLVYNVYSLNTRPRPPGTAWPPPVPMTATGETHPQASSGLLVRPSTTPAPASAMFRRRCTSASVIDSEDLCWTGVSSPGILFHFHVDVFIFPGFKGWLGVERDLEHSLVKSGCQSSITTYVEIELVV